MSDPAYNDRLAYRKTLSVPQLLSIVTERQNLDVIGEDLIDHAIGIVEDFTDRVISPLRDHPALIGQLPEQLDSRNQTIEPLDRNTRLVLRNEVDCLLSSAPGRGRPNDSQRFSLARSSVTTSS
jgi:hypothetical protein